ncbi:hypothetical protein K435DRAFT_972340 [Dendrothele bispora CBS 962.96]|uniref:Protein BIG1 n=1 Tax=Dendrothele bispora (strain CBS 962.96) TaxID=1314807 RepID=A0A4S8KW12_DENBC|nr:hypothetical protein K435DRAFT_845270 [Dendrothele bispora CBS 962.96]THU81458.1 hypothetical protein K435DRAFT_972340 [Dendrothele bispora CBS 962.96]
MTRLPLILSLSPLALAFSNTAPFIAWSSHSSSVLDRLPSTVDTHHSVHLLETILLEEDVCEHEAIVLIDQPGLHASDLRNLPSSSHVARSLSSAPSSRQFAYVPLPLPATPVDASSISAVAEAVSEKCGSRLVNMMLGQGGVEFSKEEKSIIMLSMPELELDGDRKGRVMEHDALLSTTLSSLPFTNHLTIFTGSSGRLSLSKRQDAFGSALTNSTAAPAKKKSGILHNYQLLTPALITSFLVVLFLLLPVMYFGISALASIQNPIRLEVTPKGFNAAERKNQ